MNPQQVIDDAKTKLNQIVDKYQDSLKTLRTGRASPAMLSGVMVEVYGTTIPLIQAASVSAPEAQLLQISPFDPNNIEAITSAIRNNQSLGLNPSDDGRIIRVPVPALTEERRREIAKQIGTKQEECMINLRSVRHDALHSIESSKKDKQIGEDDAKRYNSQVEDAMNAARSKVEASAKEKEKEILTI
jgi:ribosome recycling factor